MKELTTNNSVAIALKVTALNCRSVLEQMTDSEPIEEDLEGMFRCDDVAKGKLK